MISPKLAWPFKLKFGRLNHLSKTPRWHSKAFRIKHKLLTVTHKVLDDLVLEYLSILILLSSCFSLPSSSHLCSWEITTSFYFFANAIPFIELFCPHPPLPLLVVVSFSLFRFQLICQLHRKKKKTSVIILSKYVICFTELLISKQIHFKPG